MNRLKQIFLMYLLIGFCSTANAQLAGALNELKNKLDKATKELVPAKKDKKESVQSPIENTASDQSKNTTSQGLDNKCQAGQSAWECDPKISKDGAELEEKLKQLNRKVEKKEFDVASFRAEWCKSIDKSANGERSVRGITVGDICQLSDAALREIEANMSQGPVRTLMGAPLGESDLNNLAATKFRFSIRDLVIDGEPFMAFDLMVDPYSKKIYLAGMNAVVCATDETNSLDTGNVFRQALEEKYGRPTKVTRTIEIFKQRAEGAMRICKDSMARAKTIAEQRQAEEGCMVARQQEQIAKAGESNPKNQESVFLLGWGDRKVPNDEWYLSAGSQVTGLHYGTLSAVVMDGSYPNRVTSECSVRIDKGKRGHAFGVILQPTEKMMAILKQIDEQHGKQIENRAKTAPKPKL
jgi:hypothetical protein